MKKIIYLFSILAVSIFLISNCEKKISDKKTFKVEYLNNSGDFIFKDEYINEITEKSYNLIEYIKRQDTNSIVDMCFDGDIMYDSMNEGYISKQDLYKDFNNKGDVFSLFFDSEKYYKSNEKYIDHHAEDPLKRDYKLCLKDVLLKYNSIYIDTIQISQIDKSVTVYLNWDNKKTSNSGKIGYSIGFIYIENKWKIRVLLDRNAF